MQYSFTRLFAGDISKIPIVDMKFVEVNISSTFARYKDTRYNIRLPAYSRATFQKIPAKYNPYCLVRRLKLQRNKRLHVLTDLLIPRNRELTMALSVAMIYTLQTLPAVRIEECHTLLAVRTKECHTS